MAKFSGLRNRTKQDRVLTCGGEHYRFKPGQGRIVEDRIADFAETRTFVYHTEPKNAASPIVAERIFERVPLKEALAEGFEMQDDSVPLEAGVGLQDVLTQPIPTGAAGKKK